MHYLAGSGLYIELFRSADLTVPRQANIALLCTICLIISFLFYGNIKKNVVDFDIDFLVP